MPWVDSIQPITPGTTNSCATLRQSYLDFDPISGDTI
jgi:hypothetical protein